MISKKLIVGGILGLVGMFLLVISTPALLAFKHIEVSNAFTAGAFTAALLQFITAIVLLYFAYRYLNKAN